MKDFKTYVLPFILKCIGIIIGTIGAMIVGYIIMHGFNFSSGVIHFRVSGLLGLL